MPGIRKIGLAIGLNNLPRRKRKTPLLNDFTRVRIGSIFRLAPIEPVRLYESASAGTRYTQYMDVGR